MKKMSLVLAMALVLGTAISCSSKETRTDEPVISGSTGGDTTAAAPVASANLGSASSGQGR